MLNHTYKCRLTRSTTILRRGTRYPPKRHHTNTSHRSLPAPPLTPTHLSRYTPHRILYRLHPRKTLRRIRWSNRLSRPVRRFWRLPRCTLRRRLRLPWLQKQWVRWEQEEGLRAGEEREEEEGV